MAVMKRPANDKQREAIQQTLDNALQHVQPTSEGQKGVVVENIVQHEIDSYLLTHALDTLFPDIRDEQRLSHVHGAFISVANLPESSRTVESLLATLDKFFDHTGATSVQVFTFFNIRPTDAPQELTAGQWVLQKVDDFDFQNLFMRESLLKNLKQSIPDVDKWLHRLVPYQYKVVIPNIRWKNGLPFCIAEIIEPAQKVRALLNFAEKFNRSSWRFNRSPTPHSAFLRPPAYLLAIEEEMLDETIYEPVANQYIYLPTRLDEAVLKISNQLSDSLQSNSGKRRLLDFSWRLLELYQSALDATEPASTFLHYWQIVERTTSPKQEGRGIETSRLIERLGLLFNLEATEKILLRTMGDIRHEYVHSGDFPTGSGEQLNRILKRYADECVYGFLGPWLHEFANLSEIEEYFAIASNPAKDRLAAIEKAIALVRAKAK